MPQISDMYVLVCFNSGSRCFFLAGKHYSYLKGETVKSEVLQFLQRSLLSVCAHFRAGQGKSHQKIGRNFATGIKETHLFRSCLVTKLLVV